jgi:hypothetical protein
VSQAVFLGRIQAVLGAISPVRFRGRNLDRTFIRTVRMVDRCMNQESFSLVAQSSIGDNVRARGVNDCFQFGLFCSGYLNLSSVC